MTTQKLLNQRALLASTLSDVSSRAKALEDALRHVVATVELCYPKECPKSVFEAAKNGRELLYSLPKVS